MNDFLNYKSPNSYYESKIIRVDQYQRIILLSIHNDEVITVHPLVLANAKEDKKRGPTLRLDL